MGRDAAIYIRQSECICGRAEPLADGPSNGCAVYNAVWYGRTKGTLFAAIARGRGLLVSGLFRTAGGLRLGGTCFARGQRWRRLYAQRHQDLDHTCALCEQDVLLGPDNRDGRPQQGNYVSADGYGLPGVTVQPIIAMSGDHDFNQVFFDNVRVPQANRLGEEDQGWGVAKYLLEFERSVAYAAGLKSALSEVRRIATQGEDGRGGKLIDNPAVRRRIAELSAQVDAIHSVEQQVMAQVARGGNHGPASSMLKVQGPKRSRKSRNWPLNWQALTPQPTSLKSGSRAAISKAWAKTISCP